MAKATKLTLRELKGDDLFTILPIIAKLVDKKELEDLFNGSKADTSKTAQELGVTAVAGLVQKALLNIKAIRSDLNELLADLTNREVEDIQALGVTEYTGLIVELFRKHELKEVFSQASSLLTKTAGTD
jgi:hypothetical protein